MKLHKLNIVLICVAVLLLVAIFAVLIYTHIICIQHNWQSATCLKPRTCLYCGKTEGDTLNHVWMNATCTEPEICSLCGTTKGEARGHDWAQASCTKAQTCLRCENTKGDPLGHEWKAATCNTPKTCERCNETEGTKLEHVLGIAKNVGEYPVLGYYKVEHSCSLCEETIRTDTVNYTTFISGNNLIVTPYELMERVEAALDKIQGCSMTAGTKLVDGKLYGIIWDKNGKAVFAAVLIDENSNSLIDNYATNLRGMIGVVFNDDALAEVSIGFVIALDPSLSFDEAKNVAKGVLDSVLKSEAYDYNGIRYVMTRYNNSWTFNFTVISAVQAI